MKELLNYYPLKEYDAELEKSYGSLARYLEDSKLDGVELFLPRELHQNLIEETIGIHLPYLPFWLDLWYGNERRLEEQFADEAERQQYLRGADSRDTWCEAVRSSLVRAVRYEPEYLVWHVSEANREEIFTRTFYYTDENVLDATVELFRAVGDVIPPHIKILFENLWWPGLRLTAPQLVGQFLDKIGRDNIGIMLDTGHLLNTNTSLRSEREGAEYILQTVDKLGEVGGYIHGMHLQCSLSGEYVEHHPCIRPQGLSLEEELAHIMRIDHHRPFRTDAMKRVIERIEPTWLVHELYYDNLAHMQTMIAEERSRLTL